MAPAVRGRARPRAARARYDAGVRHPSRDAGSSAAALAAATFVIIACAIAAIAAGGAAFPGAAAGAAAGVPPRSRFAAPRAPLAPAAPATITLRPRYAAGEQLRWRVKIHSAITRQLGAGGEQSASLDNQALATMRVDAATDLGATVTMTVSGYHTAVSGLGPLAAALRLSTAKVDAAAAAMGPLRLRIVYGGEDQTLNPPADANAEEPAMMLEQLARTDSLPPGATAVGQRWTRERVQRLPGLRFSMPTQLRGTLTGLRRGPRGWIAELNIRANANSPLPPDSIPQFSEFAARGLAARATLTFTGDTDSEYDVASGVLAAANSRTTNLLRIVLQGAAPQATTLLTRIDSTGAVARLPAGQGGE